MIRNRIKLLAVLTIGFAVFAVLAFETETAVPVEAFGDVAADYKAKCAMCHGQKAEKAFDPAKPVDSHVQVILKGKSDSKPPMPAYEAKGMTSDEARAFAEHMLALRNP